MSIRDNMIQKVLGNPGKYSIQELQAAMQSGSLPAYVVVPIIHDKVQQQKQMQTAMAMQQQLPQTTIAEQVMQEAAQMDGGVEQLPSNLPQEYSGGGVVALADGGEVERYQGGGDLRAKALFQDLMREEQLQQQIDRIKRARDAAKAAAEAAKTAGPAAEVGAAEVGAAEAGAARAASGPSKFQTFRQALQPGVFNPEIGMPSAKGIPGALKTGARVAGKFALPLTAADLATTGYDLYNVPTDVAREYYGMQLKPGEEPSFVGDVGVRARTALGLLNPFGSTKQGITALMAKKKAEEQAAATQAEKELTPTRAAAVEEEAAPSAGGPGAGGPGAGGFMGATSIGDITNQLIAAQKAGMPAGQMTNREFVESQRKAYEDRVREIEAERSRNAAALRGEIKDPPYKDYKDELIKEREQAGVDRKTAQAEAIFKAGLAMLAGTSPRAFENIGKGALVGLEDWQKSNADLKKAAKDRQLMLAHIANAERAEKRGDIELRIKELDKAADRQLSMNDHFTNAVTTAHVHDLQGAQQMVRTAVTGASSIAGHVISGQYGLAAAEKRATGRGGISEGKLSDARKAIIEKMEAEGFMTNAYRQALGAGFGNLTAKQIKEQIVGKPEYAAKVKQAEQIFNNEIERRLARQLGQYQTGEQEQPAEPRSYPGFSLVQAP